MWGGIDRPASALNLLGRSRLSNPKPKVRSLYPQALHMLRSWRMFGVGQGGGAGQGKLGSWGV